MKIRNLLFSILRKNENKAYLNGDRLLALWLYEYCNQQVICVTDGFHPFRMRVENKIREIKIFKIMSNVYRNFQKKYNLRFNIIAGIVNLKHSF
ncbi:MAG: hypothetical protein PG980_000066 [Wolbachia endosymbiont of Ctenocephalides felis wCfeJ]|nr:MAG: hypothetical protein PG980_000066 [Wolbachia endosymbiont of Ctenocephalides felis wCfeJ]